MAEGVSGSDLECLDRYALVALVMELRAAVEELRAANEKLAAEVERLRAEAATNSGNSSKPSSRDSATERARQAEERRERAQAQAVEPRPRRKKGKQRGARGFGPKMVETPNEVVDHVPGRCSGCGDTLSGTGEVQARRQVIDLPEPKPHVTEHRAHAVTCSCGTTTVGVFPLEVPQAPVSFTPRVRAVVVYLLARQHIPVGRVRETMIDLFGIELSPGAINSFYTDAARRLGPFIAALVALLKTLPVLHADETTDRVGTDTCWMHVVSTGAYTLIQASMTRGFEAVAEIGVLVGYRGVIVHDRLALYWKLKAARHGGGVRWSVWELLTR